ncbi:hypothetical protein [Dactylosporangium aurantiacum]|nr:hypothetical protein [Dactylosporangium aurantiacum]MDG6106543.1 hypothetical protein [Dactylosporangium aurantiacum]
MVQYTCPGCGTLISVGDARRVGEPCSMCAAGQTWESLSTQDQQTILAAARHGAIAGLLAMRDLTPPIRLPHAVDLLAYLDRADPTGHRPQ